MPVVAAGLQRGVRRRGVGQRERRVHQRHQLAARGRGQRLGLQRAQPAEPASIRGPVTQVTCRLLAATSALVNDVTEPEAMPNISTRPPTPSRSSAARPTSPPTPSSSTVGACAPASAARTRSGQPGSR